VKLPNVAARPLLLAVGWLPVPARPVPTGNLRVVEGVYSLGAGRFGGLPVELGQPVRI
jgi:hypothetical protein